MNNSSYTTGEWFTSWFDSPYYHTLYRNRNEEEATSFIHLLMSHLQHKKEGKILDLACGKGRHSRTLAALGFTVTGLDLSQASIRFAQQLSPEGNPAYLVHDMREPFGALQYTLILNLFTSFGYFDTPSENEQVLRNIYNALVSGGKLVIDFLNPPHVMAHLITVEQDEFKGVQFNIQRRIESGFVFKEIHVIDSSNGFERGFTERVQLFSKDELTQMLTNVGFIVEEYFGSYNLDAWQPNSHRTIIIAKKP